MIKSIDIKSHNISETSINMNNTNSSIQTNPKSLKKIRCKKCKKCNCSCIGKNKWFLIVFIMIFIMVVLIGLAIFLVLKNANNKNNSKNLKIKTNIIYNGIIKEDNINTTITNITNNNKTRNIILVPADAEFV